jgi:hypothetical protein
VLAVMKKYMRGASDDILEETYEYTKSSLEEVPTPTLEVTKAVLEILSHQYLQAKDTDANLIIDTSVMRRIEQSGFIKALYKKVIPGWHDWNSSVAYYQLCFCAPSQRISANAAYAVPPFPMKEHGNISIDAWRVI